MLVKIKLYEAKAKSLLDKCYIHADEKNYKKAFEYCKKAADMGDANAFYALGMIYAQGLLGEKDYEKAQKYFDKASSSDNPNGYTIVYALLLTGYIKK